MKKKIIIFTGYYIPHLGGVERYVDKLSEELSSIGHEVVIVTSLHDNSLKDVSVESGRTVYRLPVYSLFRQRYPLPRLNNRYKELIKLIQAENGDAYILNTRFHLTSLIGARLARRVNKKAYLIEHGTAHFSIDNKVLDKFGAIYEHFLTWYIKRYVDGFYGVSLKCNEWLRHFKITAKGVFYNAVSPQDAKDVIALKDKRIKKDDIVISYAGRLIHDKGVTNLIDAFIAVKKNNPRANIKLLIAGDGPLLGEIKKVADKHKSILILGRLDFQHIKALFKRSDIFVHPSLYPEGLPTAILEAGLFGCAVIATPKGGTEEVICDDQHGIIIQGDIDSLKDSITELINEPSRRKLMGSNIQKIVAEKFSWSSVASHVMKEIFEVSK